MAKLIINLLTKRSHKPVNDAEINLNTVYVIIYTK
jgi:hypothetical protein